MRISFDRVAEIFDKTRGPPKHILKQLAETLANELRDYRSVLDAGVEAGRFAEPLQDNVLKVSGIDMAKKMMRKAQQKRWTTFFEQLLVLFPSEMNLST